MEKIILQFLNIEPEEYWGNSEGESTSEDDLDSIYGPIDDDDE